MNVAALFIGAPVALVVAGGAAAHLPVALALVIGIGAGFACGRALLRAIKGSGPQRH